MSDPKINEYERQLVLSVEGVPLSTDVVARAADGAPTATPAQCAVYRREEQLQYKFMVFYQILVAVLAVLALLLLVYAGYLLTRDDQSFQAALAGVAALVTGGGALFLLQQRTDARKRHAAATRALGRCGTG